MKSVPWVVRDPVGVDYMVNLLTVTGVGFLLGVRHATDPDHVIAVSTIVSRQQKIRHAGLIGALWGVGHTITIFFVGMGIILFNLAIPPRMGLAMEMSVGLMLVFLGVLNLTGVIEWITHRLTPAHDHTEETSLVFHRHGRKTDLLQKGHRLDGPLKNVLERLGLYQLLRPLAVGLVHGLAGSAAVALLVLTAIHDPRWALAYLLVFGVGTIVGMMLITIIIGIPFVYTSQRFAPFHRGLRFASGVVSIAFGLFITLQNSFSAGLFTAHPHWTPH
jgi:high-affinity nickel permease